MKTYLNPKIDFSILAPEDIVRTSITLNESGFDDEMKGIWNPEC